MILLLSGCMTMDSFFFNPSVVTAYGFESDVIPASDLEEVTIDVDDEVTLHGVWAHQEEADAPVLVYFHGNEADLDEYMRQLGDYWTFGYETFMVDYRGYGRSSGTPTWDGILQDGIATVDYVSDTTGLAIGEFPYLGLSLGGSVAVRTAVERPPSALITEDMFASGELLIDDGSGLDFPPGWLLDDEWDNTTAASQVSSRYLVMHGDSDTFIEPNHARAVFTAANEPKKLWLVPGSDHAEDSLTAPEDYRENVTCWIAGTCSE